VTRSDICVVGGGLLGRCLAWRASKAGARVVLYDAAASGWEGSAAWVAAGMIAPTTEAIDAAPQIESMGRHSLSVWPQWLAELPAPVFYRDNGTLLLWRREDAGEAVRIERIVASRQTQGHIEHVEGTQIRQLEPALGTRFSRALYIRGEAQVDNRAMLQAVAVALKEDGVECHWDTQVQDGALPDAGLVVDCRGMGARRDWPKLRGVRGEIVRLHAPEVELHCMLRLLHARCPVYIIPRASPGEREAALMQGLLFVDRSPVDGWGGRESAIMAETQAEPPPVRAVAKTVLEPAVLSAIVTPQPCEREKPAAPVMTEAQPVRPAEDRRPEISPDSLSKLQSAHQDVLDKLVRDLDKQAHFVSYAPPSFIPFHKGAYLQLSITTTLRENESGSQYRLAALAFDEHVAHLIRPVLASLTSRPDFDGIDFSSSVRLAGAAGSGVAVEFIFPAHALLCYRDYDCTGQQIINMGFVLINGERASLDLQSAESSIMTQR
jgi:glycine/D-amino acid oxidase-like deaminating enzyme